MIKYKKELNKNINNWVYNILFIDKIHKLWHKMVEYIILEKYLILLEKVDHNFNLIHVYLYIIIRIYGLIKRL